jgi:hypothetical protein
MRDDRMPADFERRIASSLHTEAPHPDPHLVDRIFQRTAETRQRRGWGGVALVAAFSAVAAGVAVLVIGLQLGNLLPPDRNVGVDPSTVVAEPSASASPSRATSRSPSPSPSVEGVPDGQRCTNDELGFSVEYPADWWANEAVVPDDAALTPIPACTYFAEEPVELQPNAGLPGGIAVIVDVADEPAGPGPTSVEVVERRETQVDGRPAVVEELEWTEDTGFQRAGDRMYSYRIQLAEGGTLVVATDTSVSGADERTYAEHRDVLDRMMESLSFTDS